MRVVPQALSVAAMIAVAGCASVKVCEIGRVDKRKISESVEPVRVDVKSVVPHVTEDANGDVRISVSLNGRFELSRTVVSADRFAADGYVAFGFFPGVMSCRGEYADCVPNAAEALLFNLAFAGLPTVYGLLAEPFVPHYPEQTDSMACRSAFVKSAILGCSKYSKKDHSEKTETTRTKSSRLVPEKIYITAPGLGLRSALGGDLVVPVSLIPESGVVGIVIELPPGHQLKSKLSAYEGVEIKVSCKKIGR